MRTEMETIGMQNKNATAERSRDPEELWLDQSVSGEDLIRLDPLKEVEDLLMIAREATGDFLETVPMRRFSSRVQRLFMKVTKRELQEKYGKETPEEFIRRLRGTK